MKKGKGNAFFSAKASQETCLVIILLFYYFGWLLCYVSFVVVELDRGEIVKSPCCIFCEKKRWLIQQIFVSGTGTANCLFLVTYLNNRETNLIIEYHYVSTCRPMIVLAPVGSLRNYPHCTKPSSVLSVIFCTYVQNRLTHVDLPSMPIRLFPKCIQFEHDELDMVQRAIMTISNFCQGFSLDLPRVPVLCQFC